MPPPGVTVPVPRVAPKENVVGAVPGVVTNPVDGAAPKLNPLFVVGVEAEDVAVAAGAPNENPPPGTVDVVVGAALVEGVPGPVPKLNGLGAAGAGVVDVVVVEAGAAPKLNKDDVAGAVLLLPSPVTALAAVGLANVPNPELPPKLGAGVVAAVEVAGVACGADENDPKENVGLAESAAGGVDTEAAAGVDPNENDAVAGGAGAELIDEEPNSDGAVGFAAVVSAVGPLAPLGVAEGVPKEKGAGVLDLLDAGSVPVPNNSAGGLTSALAGVVVGFVCGSSGFLTAPKEKSEGAAVKVEDDDGIAAGLSDGADDAGAAPNEKRDVVGAAAGSTFLTSVDTSLAFAGAPKLNPVDDAGFAAGALLSAFAGASVLSALDPPRPEKRFGTAEGAAGEAALGVAFDDFYPPQRHDQLRATSIMHNSYLPNSPQGRLLRQLS